MELDEENDAFEMLYADANGNDQKQVEQIDNFFVQGIDALTVSYTHLDVYKRQVRPCGMI